MSSNIKVQRICKHCGQEFTARTTTTQYCGSACAKRARKAQLRSAKIEASNAETLQIKTRPIEEIKAKEFLTVRDAATLLNCSVRSVYNHIDSGQIKAVNLAQRITRIRRSDLDKLFDQPQQPPPQPKRKPEPLQLEITDCYNLGEVQAKFGISEKALYEVIKRNRIPKIRKGWYAYVPKSVIDKLLT